MAIARNRYALLLAGVAIACAAWGLYWHGKLRAFEAHVASLARPGPAGFILDYDSVRYGGFPYRIEAAFTGARLTRVRDDYRLVLEAPRLTLVRQPWTPGLTLAFADDARLSLAAGKRPQALVIGAPDLQLSLRTAPDGLIQRLSLVFAAPVITSDTGLIAPLEARELQVHLRERRDERQAGGGPDLPAVGEALITAQDLGAGARRGALKLALVLRARRDGSAHLADWAASGGSLDIDRIEVKGPKLIVDGEATLSLTRTLGVQLAGALRTNDPPALKAFLATGELTPSRLTTPVQQLAVSVQDKTLSLDGTALPRIVAPLE